jgi:DNA-binding transcriptional ArsR family regulator
MNQLLSISAALADENRVRGLLALHRGGELCLCQVTELLQLASSTVSKHLSILKQAGLVESRKEARWMFYRIAREASPAAQAALDWVVVSVARDPRAIEDARKLKAILKQDPEEICKRQQSKRDACCSSAPAIPVAARWPKASPAR